MFFTRVSFCSHGGLHPGGSAPGGVACGGNPPRTRKAGGAHPTAMLVCIRKVFTIKYHNCIEVECCCNRFSFLADYKL